MILICCHEELVLSMGLRCVAINSSWRRGLLLTAAGKGDGLTLKLIQVKCVIEERGNKSQLHIVPLFESNLHDAWFRRLQQDKALAFIPKLVQFRTFYTLIAFKA